MEIGRNQHDMVEDLTTTVERASPLLYAMPAYLTSRRPSPQSWSPIEILGHFNLHLAHIMERTPASSLQRRHIDHNLDQIAWEPVPLEEPATLEYLMRDYVAHLKHHLRQIDPSMSDPPRRQREVR